MKALSRLVSWKIPNAYAAVRDAQDCGVPVAMQDSPYTRAVVRMATVACGKSLTVVNKTSRTFNFFGLRRGAASPART